MPGQGLRHVATRAGLFRGRWRPARLRHRPVAGHDHGVRPPLRRHPVRLRDGAGRRGPRGAGAGRRAIPGRGGQAPARPVRQGML